METSAHFSAHFGYKSSTRKLLVLPLQAMNSTKMHRLHSSSTTSALLKLNPCILILAFVLNKNAPLPLIVARGRELTT